MCCASSRVSGEQKAVPKGTFYVFLDAMQQPEEDEGLTHHLSSQVFVERSI